MKPNYQVPQYPVHQTIPEDDRHTRVGDALVLMFACAGLGFWGGYEVASDRGGASAAAVPMIAPCPASNLDQDILEHTWSHRGEIIHRECLIVAKPVYAQPRYSLAPKGL